MLKNGVDEKTEGSIAIWKLVFLSAVRYFPLKLVYNTLDPQNCKYHSNIAIKII